MSPKEIVENWQETASLFRESNIPITEKPLQQLLTGETLTAFLIKLNAVSGKSNSTAMDID